MLYYGNELLQEPQPGHEPPASNTMGTPHPAPGDAHKRQTSEHPPWKPESNETPAETAHIHLSHFTSCVWWPDLNHTLES